MDKFDRIFQLHHLLNNRNSPVSLETINEELECSERTSRRAISLLRDYLGAPVEYDRERNGYRYVDEEKGVYELPGLWFSPDELYALMVSYKLLADLQPGLLGSHILPIKNRIEQLLARQSVGVPDVGEYIRIFQIASRPTNLKHFRVISTALLKGRQLCVLYHGRARDKTTERIISPQRLIYYRSNWYLDAWCHMREGLRSFSLDRLHLVEMSQEKVKKIGKEILDAHFQPAYGIFTGEAKHTATLRFTSAASKWVADEEWHPEQKGLVLEDGGYELEIPYSDDRELIMDILKYGSDVKVMRPDSLKNKVLEKYIQAVEQYK